MKAALEMYLAQRGWKEPPPPKISVENVATPQDAAADPSEAAPQADAATGEESAGGFLPESI
jgi:hypothetical protein